MVEITKVTDPKLIVTDTQVLSTLSSAGIDKDYVEFYDYCKERPCQKFYRDKKSGLRIQVISGLPMVRKTDGTRLVPGFELSCGNYWIKNNLFDGYVDKYGGFHIANVNDQPNGTIAGDELHTSPILKIGSETIFPLSITIQETDFLNKNCHDNVLEIDYSVCKRYIRIIEGRFRSYWKFTEKPSGDIYIKYNASGKIPLRIGLAHCGIISIPVESPEPDVEFVRLSGAQFPTVIGSSGTFYPDAHEETASCDSYGGPSYEGDTWSTLKAAVCNNADDTAIFLIPVGMLTGTTNWLNLYRTITIFNTATIPDDAIIDSAVESLYGADVASGYPKASENGNAPSSCMYQASSASSTQLVAGDFDPADFGTTEFSDTMTYANWTDDAYNAYTCNASGIAAINKTGVTKFGFRGTQYDVGTTTPARVGNSLWDRCVSFSADKGEGYKPKLIVVYHVEYSDTLTDNIKQSDSVTPIFLPSPLISDSVIQSDAPVYAKYVREYITSSNDGYLRDVNAVFATARDAITSDFIDTTRITVGMDKPGDYDVRRAFASFSIPNFKTLLRSSLFLYGKRDFSTTDFDIYILSSTYSDTLATTDFDLFDGHQASGPYNGTVLNSSWNSSSYADEAYNEIVMDSDGLTAILAKAGDTLKLALISKEDYDNSAPANSEYVSFSASSDTGFEPYLSVIYGPFFDNTLTENVKQSDVITINSISYSALSDILNASDTIYASNLIYLAVTDNVNQSDTITPTVQFNISLSDSTKKSDVLTNYLELYASNTDIVKSSDTISAMNDILFTLSDTFKSSDSCSLVFVISDTLTDIIKQSDAIESRVIFSPSITDIINQNDITINNLTMYSVNTDNASLSDTVILSVLLSFTLSDSSKLSDITTIGKVMSDILTDNVTQSDTSSISLLIYKALLDKSNQSDALFSNGIFYNVNTDTSKLSDTISTLVTLQSTLSDSPLMSDTIFPFTTITMSQLSDGFITSDSTSSARLFTDTVSDSVIQSDSNSRTLLVYTGIIDIVKLSDSMSTNCILYNINTDNAKLSDVIATLMTMYGTGLDTTKLSDTPVPVRVISNSITDTVNLSDSHVISNLISKNLSDIINVSDISSRILIIPITLTDSANQSDTLNCVCIAYNSLTDNAKLSDLIANISNHFPVFLVKGDRYFGLN